MQMRLRYPGTTRQGSLADLTRMHPLASEFEEALANICD